MLQSLSGPAHRLLRLALSIVVFAGSLISIGPHAGAVDDATFSFTGSGWGHGVGMSQYGSLAMARAGYTAGQILTTYYTGTQISWKAYEPKIRVLLGEYPGAAGVEIVPQGGVAPTFIADTGQAASQTVGARSAVTLVNGLLRVWGPNSAAFVGGSVVRLPLDPSSPVRISQLGRRFRFGSIEFIALPNGNIRVVAAELDMEAYLYGLGEVPASWPEAALEAQAVAARTYAARRIEQSGYNRADCSCTLNSTTSDQVYVGYEKEAGPQGERWVAAVNRTVHMLVLYEGAPILAAYSSSNGGSTEASEHGFASALPYLRANPDPFDAISPDGSWSRTYSQSEMTRWLSKRTDTSVGTVRNLTISGITPGGRAAGVIIEGTTRTVTVSGNRFISVVNQGLIAEGQGFNSQLKSSKFTLDVDRVADGGFGAYDSRFRGGVDVAAGTFDFGAGIVTGPGVSGGPHVRVFDAAGTVRSEWLAYDPRFAGGTEVAACDLTGDGLSEIVTAPGPGGGPIIRAFLADGTPIAWFLAYSPTLTTGVDVACGDIDGDGVGEIVTSPLSLSSFVRAFELDGTVRTEFEAFPGARIGARIAVLNDPAGGQPSRIVTGTGAGGAPVVRMYRVDGVLLSEFAAYDMRFRGGIAVAAGDATGDAAHEIVTGPGNGGGPWVRVFSPGGAALWEHLSPALGSTAGARVAVLPASRIVVMTSGPGTAPRVLSAGP